jgi:predicted N-acetyltransferase YhbS
VKIELTEPRTEEEFDQYHQLRYERLRKPHGLPRGSERDDPAEASSTHVIAKVDGRVVGAACWVVGMRRDDPPGTRHTFVRFRQMAIDHDFDNRGIGIVMTRHIEKAARALGAKEILGNVRVERVPYFERLGYVVKGDGETLFGSVEHVSMAKPLR